MLRPHPAALCEAGPRASDSLQDCCKMPEARWPLQTLDETQRRDAIQASTTWGTEARATTGRPDPVVFNADDAGETGGTTWSHHRHYDGPDGDQEE